MKKEMEIKTLRLLIHGKVQGVFYRVSAKEKAQELGICGWVKNTKEGNVEIVCQGKEDQMQQFINWCKRGPSNAKVEKVDVTEVNYTPFESFSVIRGY